MNSPQNLLGNLFSDGLLLELWGQNEGSEETMCVDTGYLISNPSKGISISVDGNYTIKTITFFSNVNSKVNSHYKCYKGHLPENVRFGMTRKEVDNILGNPNEISRKYKSYMGVEIRPWNYYIRQSYNMTIEFDKTASRVVAVSITIDEF
jgi:hypothetical protein